MAANPSRLAAVRATVPEGTVVVAGGLVVSGIATYGYLVATARILGPERYAPISVLWAATVLAALGVFLPVEQEVARAVSALRATGDGARSVVVRSAQIGAALAATLTVAAVALAGVLASGLFDRSIGVALAFAMSLTAYYCVHLSRGTFAGIGRFDGYAAIVGGEPVVRLAACIALIAVGVHTAAPYAFALALAPLVAVAAVALWIRPGLEAGPPVDLRTPARSIAQLVAASVFAQALVNGPTVAVKALAASSESAAVSRFIAGLVVARIPLFMFAAIQAALIPKLSALAAAGKRQEFNALVLRLAAAVAAITAAATAVAAAVGPFVVRRLFGGGFALGGGDLALLAAGSGVFMLALACAQAVIAVGAYRRVTAAWVTGFAVFVGALARQGAVVLRVEVAFVAGAVAAAAAMAVFAARSAPGQPMKYSASLIDPFDP